MKRIKLQKLVVVKTDENEKIKGHYKVMLCRLVLSAIQVQNNINTKLMLHIDF